MTIYALSTGPGISGIAVIRVSGKKRDDLQSSIAIIKEKFCNLPLQFINFRDWSY